mmetsp:Transcript_83586/g.235821  ORF Transcript_83586/g.235821 Transcript_83586/m.235821 type:complete len:283 (-) Transcript_83586:614-1462(-)
MAACDTASVRFNFHPGAQSGPDAKCGQCVHGLCPIPVQRPQNWREVDMSSTSSHSSSTPAASPFPLTELPTEPPAELPADAAAVAPPLLEPRHFVGSVIPGASLPVHPRSSQLPRPSSLRSREGTPAASLSASHALPVRASSSVIVATAATDAGLMATACSVRPYVGPLLGLLMTRGALVGLAGVKGRPSVAEAGLFARPTESESESESESKSESRASPSLLSSWPTNCWPPNSSSSSSSSSSASSCSPSSSSSSSVSLCPSSPSSSLSYSLSRSGLNLLPE